MGVEMEEIEDVWRTFPLQRIRRQELGPQRLALPILTSLSGSFSTSDVGCLKGLLLHFTPASGASVGFRAEASPQRSSISPLCHLLMHRLTMLRSCLQPSLSPLDGLARTHLGKRNNLRQLLELDGLSKMAEKTPVIRSAQSS